MSFETLQERLTALQETTAQLKELIDRLSNLKFQPGSVPLAGGDEDGDNVGAELSAEIGQILREEEEDLELLQEEITDLRPSRPGSDVEHSKLRLKDGAARLQEELRSSRVAFRKAQLLAKRSLEQAQRQERELLLASYSAPLNRSGASSPASSLTQSQQLLPPNYHHRRRHHQQGQDQKDGSSALSGTDGTTVTAATDVTAALRRTHDLLALELSRSDFARQTLAESTAALTQLGEQYGTLEGALASSRDLLGALLRSNKSDTWYLETALYALLATLGWLIFRRWLYGPLWWIVWLPLRTLWGAGARVGSAVGNAGGGGAGARMEVSGGGYDGKREGARVVGMEEGVVPTARVAGESSGGQSDPNSMIEKVGRIVDGSQDESGERGQSGQGEDRNQSDENGQPNPKKRMWEEEKEAQRVKDEL